MGLSERANSVCGMPGRHFNLRVSNTAVAALVVAIAAMAAHSIFVPRYQTPDDAIMSMRAAGECFVDQPTPHLLFMNILVGILLSSLYQLEDSVPFYGIHVLLMQIASLFAIAYAALPHCHRYGKAIAVSTFVATFGIYYLINPQFTIISFYLTTSGYLLLLSWLYNRPARRPSAARLAAASALIVYGYLIRVESFLLATLLFGGVLVVCLMADRGRIRVAWTMHRRRLLSQITATVIAICIAAIANFLAYSSAEWRQWRTSTTLRGQLYYYHISYDGTTRHLYEHAGWTENDGKVFMQWLVFEPDGVFRAANIRRLKKALMRLRISRARQVLSSWYYEIKYGPERPGVTMMFAAVPLVSVLTMCSGRRSGVVMAVILSASLLVTLQILMWAPARVYFCLASFPLVIGLVLSRGRNKGYIAAILVSVVVALLGTYEFWHKSWLGGCMHTATRAQLLAKDARDLTCGPSDVYVCNGAFPVEYRTVFATWRWSPTLKLLDQTITPQSPDYLARKKAAGIVDVYIALLDRPRTFIICREEHIELLKVFYLEHYGLRVNAEPEQVLRTFTAWRIRRCGEEPIDRADAAC